jgi:hypothetical protein
MQKCAAELLFKEIEFDAQQARAFGEAVKNKPSTKVGFYIKSITLSENQELLYSPFALQNNLEPLVISLAKLSPNIVNFTLSEHYYGYI